jgi:SAM-dependent methyltransferase
VPATKDSRPPATRYPLRNADAREGQRLSLLEGLSDPVTIRWFEQLGVAPGWHCAELGAGRGSMAAWLADRVGPGGSVLAVDRDTAQLAELAARPNVCVVEGDLCTMTLPAGAHDLVHSRAVLMHLEAPDDAVARAVASLRPGGIAFFEETDGAPAQEAEGLPEPYHAVMVPMAARWTWARRLPALLDALGMVEIEDDVRSDPITGGTPLAAFWKHTLGSVLEMLERRTDGGADGAGDTEAPANAVGREQVEAMMLLLDDPGFVAPFSARHRVTARKPA